jgi:hypothetical protein
MCGFIGAGKSTVANYLVANYNYTRLSFAGTLKDTCAVLFGWDRTRLEGATPEDRAWREQPDPFWSEKFGKPWTPRWALQFVGTEVVRNTLHRDMWVLSVEQKLHSMGPDAKVVFDDARFVNELNTLTKYGATLVVVQRPQTITVEHQNLWCSLYSSRPRAVEEAVAASSLHASEKDWLLAIDSADAKYLQNDGDYPSLYKNVDKLISEIS